MKIGPPVLSSSLVTARVTPRQVRRAIELRLAFIALAVVLVGCGGGGFGTTATSSSSSSASPSPSSSSSASPTASSSPGAAVAYVNSLRALAGLPAVTENTALGQGLAAHALYMVKNNVIGHSESSALPFFSPEGDTAARNANLAVSTDVSQPDTFAIDGWITGPFHAAGILDTTMESTCFSSYAETKNGFRYGACLDVLRGLGSQPRSTFPVVWPGNNTVVGLSSYGGNESPDPLTSTPGFTAPSGLPLYVLLGTGGVTPQVTASSLSSRGIGLTHAVFDETSYVNPDSGTQSLGRAVLASRDMVVIIPRDPLVRGETYSVSLTVSGQIISWTFAVASNAR